MEMMVCSEPLDVDTAEFLYHLSTYAFKSVLPASSIEGAHKDY